LEFFRFSNEGVVVKSVRLFHIVALLVLALALGCNKPNASSSSTDNPAGAAASPGNGAPGSADAKATPAPIVIPAGKTITVRLGEALSSKDSHAGQEFTASVAEPVTVDGETVIHERATAHGVVVDAKAMGHFKGGALLHVRLESVVINGQSQHIQTTAAGGQLKGKGKRSTVAIAGGTGVGAALGAIFGGGKGAAIGAAAGAGAGTAGAAFTGNKEIVFPAESTLSFKLTHSVEVRRQ
jgi:outer membrane scaffolding protein for murein synthesis (MipA/OmpV family)